MAQATKKSVKTRKKVKKTIVEGCVYIQATFNNTIVTMTDAKGDPFAWSSAAAIGYRGARKSTPFAAAETAKQLAVRCKEQFGLSRVRAKVKGAGSGRDSAIRAIEAGGVKVISIEDVTGIPHNGCRDPKKRRV